MNEKNPTKKQQHILFILGLISFILAGIFVFRGITPSNYSYFLSRRIPRLLAMLLTGGGIAYASVIFQTITHNRILTPSVMGLDSLYLFLQTVVLFLFGSTSSWFLDPRLNFLLSLGAMAFVSIVIFPSFLKGERQNLFRLLLIGILLGTFFQSLSSFMQMVMDPNEFSIVQNRMFASFNSVNRELLLISSILVALLVLIVRRFHPSLDVMSLGRDNAVNLGVSYDYVVRSMLAIIGIFVAVSTALIGPVTFLGILVANLARELMQSYKHHMILPSAIFISIIALVGGQLFVELVLGGGIPVSLVINFVGGIYFIKILLKEGRIS